MTFTPFDEEYQFDQNVLNEDFPPYLMPGVKAWIFKTLKNNGMFSGVIGRGQVLDNFLHSLNRVLRTDIPSNDIYFFNTIKSDVRLFRNVLSYMLQKVANTQEANQLERILKEGSSAYAVEFEHGSEIAGFRTKESESIFNIVGSRLVYRVSPIVKKQAQPVLNESILLAQAWDAHYGINPDDEKVVTRCTDAIAGIIKDTYFPGEERSQLGTLVAKIRKQPTKYSFPADSIYETVKLLDLMQDFSKIRGNHKTGTGRAPTHEEASFVLHFSIMLFHLLGSKK